MENFTLMLFICLSVPLLMMLPLFKARSRYVVAMFITGMFFCAVAGNVNTLVCNLADFSHPYAVINITPIVEELLKALPVAFVVIAFQPKRQTVLECALASGIGFATLENVSIFASSASQISIGYILVRAFGAGLMHGMCAIGVGYAMSFISVKKNMAFTITLAALSLSMIYHSVFNILITSDKSILGCLFPVISFLPVIIFIFRQKDYLKEENK